MSDPVVIVNVPGPGEGGVVEVVLPGGSISPVPDPPADLGPLTARVDVLEGSDATQNNRLTALELGGGTSIPSLAYRHEQALSSSVWVIVHGLPFRPSGIGVVDHLGNPHYPVITWPDDTTVQLAFGYDVRGVARLS